MGEACLNFETHFGTVQCSERHDAAWYAVQTGYRCEHRVASALTIKGISTYLPIIREVRQWNDRRKVIEAPAFSGYLFVHYEPTLRNRVRILETSGIVCLLGGNHAPSQISDLEIEDVRRTLSSGVQCERCDALTPGTLVRVMRGPLAGVRGRLARIKNSVRLVITISVSSQAISAELGLDDVQTVDEHSLNSQSAEM